MSEPASVPWEQQAGESARAFGAFCAYRDLGPQRSLRTAAEKFYGRSSAAVSRQFQAWSGTFKWVERASAWDQHLDAEVRHAQEEARREMGERHVKEARALQSKALERLRTLRPEEMGPADVLRFFVEASKLERLALGEPDSLQRQELTGKHGGPLILSIIEEVVGSKPALQDIVEEVITSDNCSTDGQENPRPPSTAGVPPQ